MTTVLDRLLVFALVLVIAYLIRVILKQKILLGQQDHLLREILDTSQVLSQTNQDLVTYLREVGALSSDVVGPVQ